MHSIARLKTGCRLSAFGYRFLPLQYSTSLRVDRVRDCILIIGTVTIIGIGSMSVRPSVSHISRRHGAVRPQSGHVEVVVARRRLTRRQISPKAGVKTVRLTDCRRSRVRDRERDLERAGRPSERASSRLLLGLLSRNDRPSCGDDGRAAASYEPRSVEQNRRRCDSSYS